MSVYNETPCHAEFYSPVKLSEAFAGLYRGKYDLAVVYTDVLRRTAQQYGPRSDQMQDKLHELDDLLQARLIDARSKAEQFGKKVMKKNIRIVCF